MASSPLPFENSHVWRIKIEGELSRVFLNHGGIFIMSGENVAIRILSYRIPGQHASIFAPHQLVWTLYVIDMSANVYTLIANARVTLGQRACNMYACMIESVTGAIYSGS